MHPRPFAIAAFAIYLAKEFVVLFVLTKLLIPYHLMATLIVNRVQLEFSSFNPILIHHRTWGGQPLIFGQVGVLTGSVGNFKALVFEIGSLLATLYAKHALVGQQFQNMAFAGYWQRLFSVRESRQRAWKMRNCLCCDNLKTFRIFMPFLDVPLPYSY